ncbi:hypothetical protein [Alkalibacterium kapii]|uniref:MFS transporter n=1 Tax=Alkalibacterium kapii TaxID=426704 RepID=A0A511ARD9_9LACT|nr:hypothetical protein [Alkalibacterium kapii]GEK90774.1 hypothetical protein AKA01nite_03960 [Alkalibacterium kapii]
MWLLFGSIAIIATIVNLYLYKTGKDYTWAMALGLSFTALTLVAEYSMVSDWVKGEDWAALLDVVPTMTTTLWILVMGSIILNIAPVYLERRVKS